VIHHSEERAGDRIALTVREGVGDAVFWVHGYTFDASVWSPVWDELPGWRHVAPDVPGHGRSRDIRRGETLSDLARSMVELAVAHETRHLVGLSLGGRVALQMAIEHPKAFKTLALNSPSIGGGPNDPASRKRHAQLTQLYRERGPGPWMTELWMSSPPHIFTGACGHPLLWRSLRDAVDRHRWRELTDSRLGGLVARPGQLQETSGIRAATLVIVGEHDIPSFQRGAELLRRRVDGCTRVYCQGAGHLALLERPTEVAPLLGAHFRGNRG
jgi:pimeloyl-ACP methyl ester carboxylesterase